MKVACMMFVLTSALVGCKNQNMPITHDQKLTEVSKNFKVVSVNKHLRHMEVDLQDIKTGEIYHDVELAQSCFSPNQGQVLNLKEVTYQGQQSKYSIIQGLDKYSCSSSI